MLIKNQFKLIDKRILLFKYNINLNIILFLLVLTNNES